MKRRVNLLWICLALLMASCNKEIPMPQPEQENVELTFKLGVPGSGKEAIQTYALTEREEAYMEDVILLAFKVIGGDLEVLDYYKEGMQVFNTLNAPNEKRFYLSLPKSEDTYRFVVLANGGK